MAINQNFVIKNGVEVNTNLLVGDSTLNKRIGIGTTLPEYTLHIGIGAGEDSAWWYWCYRYTC